MSQDRDIGYAIFGVGFGIWSFFHGLGALRKKRYIECIPTSTIRGLAMGIAELNGKATRTKTLISPLTQTECTYYRYTIERYESSGRSSHWVTISSGDSSMCPFCVDDGTGQIMVLPKGAEFIMPTDYVYVTEGSFMPPNLVIFMQAHAVAYQGLFGGYRLRFSEWYIKPEESVFVVGTAQKNVDQVDTHQQAVSERLTDVKSYIDKSSDANLIQEGGVGIAGWKRVEASAEHNLLQQQTSAQDEATSVIIAKGNGEVFIVSDESQKKVCDSFSWQAVWGIWGGAGLTLVLLAYLLFRFGVWANF